MIYLELFWSLFQIGLLSFGGGYVAIPLIQHQVVELHGWLSMAEFTDLISIAEMTPGPIALNSATYVGIRVAGIPGALVATFGCVLPSCMIVTLLAFAYYRWRSMNAMRWALSGLRPCVVAMIASAGMGILLLSFFGSSALPPVFSDVRFISVAIFAAALFALRRWKLNPVYIMAGAGAVGVIAYSLL